MTNRGPMFLIVSLIAVLVFIGGVKYGQQVEKANKVIDYIVSLTPKPKPPTPTPTAFMVRYKTLSHADCSVSFLYPDYLKPGKTTSNSAELVQGDVTQLVFSCADKKPAFAAFDESIDATEEAKLNRETGDDVYFKLNKDLVPLLDSSISYEVEVEDEAPAASTSAQ